MIANQWPLKWSSLALYIDYHDEKFELAFSHAIPISFLYFDVYSFCIFFRFTGSFPFYDKPFNLFTLLLSDEIVFVKFSRETF